MTILYALFWNSEKFHVCCHFRILNENLHSLTKIEWEKYPKSQFLKQQHKIFQIKRVCTKKSIMTHDFFWSYKVPNIIFIHNTYFKFVWEMNNMPILAKMLVPYHKTKSQLIQHFNMVHPRDISLAESRGSSRFLST